MKPTLALLLVLTAPAVAAPLCVEVQGVPPQCLYVDASACRTEALRRGGACVANPQELTTPPGPGKFCMAESGLAITCVYPDRASCQAEATRRGGACIEASQPPSGSSDPFRIRRSY